jgi:A/G-specific adenine glycosylase
MSSIKDFDAPGFQQALLNWFHSHGRHDLPWQLNPTPYRVWVSEIMLQQTQVSAVKGYYAAFMARFPSVEDLAAASEDAVLHAWSGLGYYSRARNLHKAAQQIVAQGGFPKTLESVMSLPGVGRSTAGAILSLSQGQAHPILDGNVKRVLCRVFAIDSWSGDTQTQKQLWRLAEALTPKDTQAGPFNQAMMDLGSGVCRRSNPLCDFCPLSPVCQAKAQGLQKQLPVPKPKKTLPVKETDFYLLLREAKQGGLPEVLLEKRPAKGIWGGLYAFPQSLEGLGFAQEITPEDWPVMRHTFSHYHLDYRPHLVRLTAQSAHCADSRLTEPLWHWYNLNQPEPLGLPAPITRLLEAITADWQGAST